jgi:hypothetical protein
LKGRRREEGGEGRRDGPAMLTSPDFIDHSKTASSRKTHICFIPYLLYLLVFAIDKHIRTVPVNFLLTLTVPVN